MVLLGDTFTGKTSLVLRFAEGYYRESARSATVGAFFITKRLTVPSVGLTCKIQIWDTAGQEQFKPLAPMYYKSAAAAICCYDATSSKSLETLKYWLDELHKNIPAGRIVIAMAACKCDLLQQQQSAGASNEERENWKKHMASLREVEDLAAQMGAIFVPTSAKSNENVTELFSQVAERVLLFQKKNKNSLPVTLGGKTESRSQPTSPSVSPNSNKPLSSSALPSLGLLPGANSISKQPRSKSMNGIMISSSPITDANISHNNDDEDAILNDMNREDYLHRRNHHVVSNGGLDLTPQNLAKTNSMRVEQNPLSHMTSEAPDIPMSNPGSTMCGDTDILNCALVPERFQDQSNRCVIL